jgi:hypothetical protein
MEELLGSAHPPKRYETSHELDYIKGLAYGGYCAKQSRHDGRKALEKYLAAAEQRTVWGRVKKFDCVRYARALLESL